MASSMATNIPSTQRALLLNSRRDPYDMEVINQPTPQVGPGSAVIRVLVAGVLSYSDQIYTGRRPYPFPTPLVPGTSAIGRVAALGLDSTMLQEGQLVFFDSFISGRDDPTSIILSGIFSGVTPGSNKLMEGEWRNSTYAEYAKVPLENCFALNEEILLGKPSDGGLGYEMSDLKYLGTLLVPLGGLRDVNLRAGERVVITPATGSFGSAAVLVALAMGAQVIAMGRDLEALEKVKALGPDGRVEIVQNTGDVAADIKTLTRKGPLDVFYDISPDTAAESTHFTSCIQSLRRGGRASLMGAPKEVMLPTSIMMRNDITVKGKWMFTKDDVGFMIKLAEAGFLKLGQAGGIQTAGTFTLEQFAEAFDTAAKTKGPCTQTVIIP